MRNNKTLQDKVLNFEVIEVRELIETFAQVFNIQAENLEYYLCDDLLERDSKRSLFFLTDLILSDIKSPITYLGNLKNSKENSHEGIVFTFDKNKIGIFYRPNDAKIKLDYNLVLRDENKILYRGGIISGKGYQMEKSFEVVPNTRFTLSTLINENKNYSDYKSKNLTFIIGYNPHS